MLIRRTETHIDPKDFTLLLILGLLVIPANQLLFLLGINLTHPTHGALLYSLTPILITLLAQKEKLETITVGRVIGILLAFVGVVMVILQHGVDFKLKEFRGDLLIFLAVLSWAVYSVYGIPVVKKYGALKVTAYTYLLGTATFIPVALWRLPSFEFERVTFVGWGALLYMVFLTSVFAYVIWHWFFRRLEASKVAVLTNLQPVLTGLIVWMLQKEPPNPIFWVGTAFTLIGLYITESR